MIILGFVGALVLLVAVFPIVVVLLRNILLTAKTITPTIDAIAGVAVAGSRDLNAVKLLYTTQAGVSQTIGVVADFGGSLDILLEDA
jgi:hypothetical protein